MADYSKTAASALATIKKKGKRFEIKRPVMSFPNSDGIPVVSEPQTGFINAIILPRYKGQIFQSLDDSLKEALIKGRLKTVLAAAQGAPFKPEALDVITIAGSYWNVIGCTELAPDGETPIIYTIGVMEGAQVSTPPP
jgi:hypothetical protein